jgi:hypothetical protein
MNAPQFQALNLDRLISRAMATADRSVPPGGGMESVYPAYRDADHEVTITVHVTRRERVA